MTRYSFFIILLIVFFGYQGSFAAEVEVGDKAPAFTARDDSGNQWDLGDHVGEDFIILYFYPAAMTGGCTNQACSYRDGMSQIKDLDAMVVGVSGDEVEGLKLFKEAHNLNFTLLSDPEGEISRKYGVPVGDGGAIERNINGETLTLNRGVTASRWTFVIDKEGKVIYKKADVNPNEDMSRVIEFIRNYKK